MEALSRQRALSRRLLLTYTLQSRFTQDKQTTPQDSPSSNARENAESPHSPDGPTEDEVWEHGVIYMADGFKNQEVRT